MNKKIIVVGGGAAGMLSAIAASDGRADVHIYEKNEKLGKKIYITGKGRCNITNACDEIQTLLDNVISNPRFLYSAFYSFGNHDIIKLLKENGLEVKTERGLRVFPESDRASDVIKTLTAILRKSGVKIHLESQVERLLISDGKVEGILLKDGQSIIADAVIVATGGISYPSTGSTGDGYRMAQQAGHTITKLHPSLVPFTVSEEWCKSLQGLSLKNVSFTLYQKNKKKYEDFGEMMFTHFGITGPVVLSASSLYAKLAGKGQVKAYIDLKPALSESQLDERVLRDFNENINRQLGNAVKRLMPASLIPVILSLAGLDEHAYVRDISREERLRFVRTMKHMELTISGTRGYNEAIVTQGGINVKEIKPDTMESKKIQGLYFAGEVLDLDGLTGGFNLQIAWSTGHAAGLAASEQ